jgi:hypothetical protein
VTVPAADTIVRNSGTPNGARWLRCGVAEIKSEEWSGGTGAQAECPGLRAGAAAPGAGRRPGAGPGAPSRGAARSSGAGRGQARAHPVPVRAATPRTRPRRADREPPFPAGHPGPPGPVTGRRAGGAGPVRGGPQRRRGGRRALGGPPRAARRRARPPPAPPAAGAAPGRPAGPGSRAGRPCRSAAVPAGRSAARWSGPRPR